MGFHPIELNHAVSFEEARMTIICKKNIPGMMDETQMQTFGTNDIILGEIIIAFILGDNKGIRKRLRRKDETIGNIIWFILADYLVAFIGPSLDYYYSLPLLEFLWEANASKLLS